MNYLSSLLPATPPTCKSQASRSPTQGSPLITLVSTHSIPAHPSTASSGDQYSSPNASTRDRYSHPPLPHNTLLLARARYSPLCPRQILSSSWPPGTQLLTPWQILTSSPASDTYLLLAARYSPPAGARYSPSISPPPDTHLPPARCSRLHPRQMFTSSSLVTDTHPTDHFLPLAHL